MEDNFEKFFADIDSDEDDVPEVDVEEYFEEVFMHAEDMGDGDALDPVRRPTYCSDYIRSFLSIFQYKLR